MALSRVVSEIFNVEKCDLEMGAKGHSRSLRVVSFDTLCMVSYRTKIANFSHPCVFNGPTEGVPLGIGYRCRGQRKLE